MTCRTADLCSLVTRAVEFIDWRSFKRIPGFRDAIVYVFVKERERGPGFEDESWRLRAEAHLAVTLFEFQILMF